MILEKIGTLGIIGGTGWMGYAMLKQFLAHGFTADAIWVSNRSGQKNQLAAWKGLHFTTNNEELARACHTIVLALRPQDFQQLQLKLSDHLIISVMAGVSIEAIRKQTGANYIIRAMPNAAVEIAASYTPWFCDQHLDNETMGCVQQLFENLGTTDRLETEDELNFFTALTGSGQGWLAYLQDCFLRIALKKEVSPAIAARAIRQLFFGISQLLAEAKNEPKALIKILIDYAGTTAAGLKVMQGSQIAKEIEKAIEAAYDKAQSDMRQ